MRLDLGLDIGMRLTGSLGSLSTAVARHRPTHAWASLGVAGAMALISALDRATRLPGVQHLYYVPIVFAAIRFGTRGGVSVAAVAILLYHLADPRALTFRYEESDLLWGRKPYGPSARSPPRIFRLTQSPVVTEAMSSSSPCHGAGRHRPFASQTICVVRCTPGPPALAGLQFPKNTLSISVGVASLSFDGAASEAVAATDDETAEALFRAADAALYNAKNGGRNRVHDG